MDRSKNKPLKHILILKLSSCYNFKLCFDFYFYKDLSFAVFQPYTTLMEQVSPSILSPLGLSQHLLLALTDAGSSEFDQPRSITSAMSGYMTVGQKETWQHL